MAILNLGISYRRAPIELLERLAFTDDDLTKAYRRALDEDAIEEAVILSTCNRVEVYASVPTYHSGFQAVKRFLAETREVDPDELVEPMYANWERDAADHLFAVASGLDSMVVGETQIGTQVREAIRRAQGEAAAGPALTGLFHAAGRAGRRVRGETALGAAPDAYVAIGTDLAVEIIGGIAGRSVAVIGAGQMASLAVKHLRHRGAGPVRILNRSVERARALAERTDADHGDLEALPEALAEADLVISATGAPAIVIGADALRGATRRRARGPLVLIDLAVPRDVEPAAAQLPGVHVIDVGALRERVALHGEATAEEIAHGHEIVAEEVRRFVVRRRADDLAPLIRAIRERGAQIVQRELDRQATRLADLTPQERSAVESLARGIAAKLLHDPIVELKERTEPGSERAHARLLAELLGIDPDVS
ncbi:MAG TPA: glutamyl-tRNA reductase [Actinomycetota bacterium]